MELATLSRLHPTVLAPDAHIDRESLHHRSSGGNHRDRRWIRGRRDREYPPRGDLRTSAGAFDLLRLRESVGQFPTPGRPCKRPAWRIGWVAARRPSENRGA